MAATIYGLLENTMLYDRVVARFPIPGEKTTHITWMFEGCQNHTILQSPFVSDKILESIEGSSYSSYKFYFNSPGLHELKHYETIITADTVPTEKRVIFGILSPNNLESIGIKHENLKQSLIKIFLPEHLDTIVTPR